MDEYRFNCSLGLAQKFWFVCKADGETPGAVLREFIEKRVSHYEESFGTVKTPVGGADKDESLVLCASGSS